MSDTTDDREETKARIAALRAEIGSFRAWVRHTLRHTVVVLVLFLALWGLGTSPETAARVSFGLFSLGSLALAIASGVLLAASSIASAALSDRK